MNAFRLLPGMPGSASWQSKLPIDIVSRGIDLGPTLVSLFSSSGRSIAITSNPIITSEPSITVSSVAVQGSIIRMVISGGLPGTFPTVALLVQFTDGQQQFVITQPIEGPAGIALPPAQAGGYLGLPAPTTLAALPAAPSGTFGADVLVRVGGIMQTVPASSLVSVAAPVQQVQATGFVAGAAIGGHRVLMFDGAGSVIQADSTATSYQFAGISTGAAASGAAVTPAEAGQTVTEPSWAWAPGAPIYTGLTGNLTQTPPTSGWLQQVGVAVTPTTILVQPFAAIYRS